MEKEMSDDNMQNQIVLTKDSMQSLANTSLIVTEMPDKEHEEE